MTPQETIVQQQRHIDTLQAQLFEALVEIDRAKHLIQLLMDKLKKYEKVQLNG